MDCVGPDGLVFPTFVDWSKVDIKMLDRTSADSISSVIKDSEINTQAYIQEVYKKTNNERK